MYMDLEKFSDKVFCYSLQFENAHDNLNAFMRMKNGKPITNEENVEFQRLNDEIKRVNNNFKKFLKRNGVPKSQYRAYFPF